MDHLYISWLCPDIKTQAGFSPIGCMGAWSTQRPSNCLLFHDFVPLRTSSNLALSTLQPLTDRNASHYVFRTRGRAQPLKSQVISVRNCNARRIFEHLDLSANVQSRKAYSHPNWLSIGKDASLLRCKNSLKRIFVCIGTVL